MSDTIRVGLIGAGYIATWHAEALSATDGRDHWLPSAMCPWAPRRRWPTGLARRRLRSVEDLIDSGTCDAVHILTPPHLHHDLAVQCLKGGLHVLVEKPVAESADQTRMIEAAAQKSGKRFHAGHNFLGMPSYLRLKDMHDKGLLGRVSAAEINWCFPLAPLRSGPYGLWLLREPKNLLLELGPHLMAFAVDLFGTARGAALRAVQTRGPARGRHAPAGLAHPRRGPGDVDITFTIALVETMDDRSGHAARVHGTRAV